MKEADLRSMSAVLENESAGYGGSPSASAGKYDQASTLANRSSSTDGGPADELMMREAMVKDLTSWGNGLILMGFAHIVFASFLDPLWGVIIIILGVLSLTIKTRGMFIVIGLGLWFAAFINITAAAPGLWTLYGILQIFWGVQEMARFRRCRTL